MLRTTSRGAHRAAGPAVIDYRALSRPVGRTVGGVAVLSAVAAGTMAQGADEARAQAPANVEAHRASGVSTAAAGTARPSIVLSEVKLRPGARGEAVRLLQRALNQRGASIKVDGSFGSATTRAVRTFQGRASIGVDGIVGSRTRAALIGGADRPAPAQPKLRRGDRGDAVRTLQHRLNERGAGISADGSFGRATDGAVRSLQRSAGIGIDGVVGAHTWSALDSGASASAPAAPEARAAAPVGQPKLRRGDRGDAVRALQEKLNDRGAGIRADGSFGPSTLTAVRGLQRAAGIGVDGVVGPRTWSAASDGGLRISEQAASRSAERSAPSRDGWDGAAIVAAARTQLDATYVWGGEQDGAVDCSGLVHYAYNQAGYKIPRRTARGYFQNGTVISKSEAVPGDLVVFTSRNYGHVGIYLGDGRIIDAAGVGRGVLERKIWSAPHVFVRYR